MNKKKTNVKNNTMPMHSMDISAGDASFEFPYTWVDMETSEWGMFYKTQQDAMVAANENYLGFPKSMEFRKVAVVKFCEILQYMD